MRELIVFCCCSALMLLSFTTQGTENVRLHGALVSEPCSIVAGEENMKLDFGTVIDKYLYLNQRTHGQRLELHLENCDLSLGNTVRMRFSGTENTHLPGFLAVDASSQASGIAIGLENLEGKALPVNLIGQKYPLVAGSSVIAVKAYIQGEPEALNNSALKLGTFNATAIFNLEYE